MTNGVSKGQVNTKIKSISNRKKYIGETRVFEIQEESEGIVQLVNKLKDSKYVEGNKISFQLDINGIDSSFFLKNIKHIELMEDLEFLSAPSILFRKDDSFDFEHTSSGEKHLFFTMLNLLANIEDNSLVLIDEPELSLHPSWQMKYISLIKEVTKEFTGVHILLASHSHFLVSGLLPESSSLVSISSKANEKGSSRLCELIEHSTYAWSAENILYKVFGLRTSRNYYFEIDLARVLKMISIENSDLGEIREIYDRISSLVIDRDDPLNTVLADIKAYTEKRADD